MVSSTVMRAGGLLLLLLWVGVACETKSRDLRVFNSNIFRSKKLNGLQYHAGIIQQHFIHVYTRVASSSWLASSYLVSRLVDDLEHFDNQ